MKPSILSVFALVAAALAAGSAQAQIDCCALPAGTVTGVVNQDVVAAGCSCTIARSAFVNGNVIQIGTGDLVVRGSVNGGADEDGLGNLIVDGGTLAGDCSEFDGGSLVVRAGSNINGKMFEAGAGRVDVTVGSNGPAKGDIEESGAGNVLVTTLGGAYEGTLVENDGGSAVVSVGPGTSFKGGIIENGLGNAGATVDGIFEGNIEEYLGGNLSTVGTGVFKGNTEHEAPGFCSNSIAQFEGNACSPL